MSRVLPILFNTEMVRSILAGRKTVTRRAVKSGEIIQPDQEININLKGQYELYNVTPRCGIPQKIFFKPRYQPGDILYVRETWQQLWELDGNEEIIEGTEKYYYAATDTVPFDTYVDYMGVTHYKTPWRPSIYMPKAAARIWLKVTDVRVERLRNITEEQAIKEGFEGIPCGCYSPSICTDCMGTGWQEPPVVGFICTWDSTIKKPDLDRYGWDANPWVWVIEFEWCEKPQEGADNGKRKV